MSDKITPMGDRIRAARESARMTQEGLAKEVGTFQQTIEKIESGKVQHSRYLNAILERLGLEVSPTVENPTEGRRQAQTAPLVGERDLPVFGTAEGGRGAMVVSDDPVEHVRRPAPLENVRDGYAVRVIGDSMEPKFEPGDLILVHPHLPPAPNVDVVLFSAREGDGHVIIKRLVKFTETEWVLRQHNPLKDFRLKRKDWPKCHRIVGSYSRR